MGQANKIDNFQLWQRYKEEGDREAREELILEYLSLVKYHAGRVDMMIPDFIDREDLESFGVIGLLDALEKFDYRRGIEFKTYAGRRIRGEIIDHLRKLDWLPHSLRREGKKIKDTGERLAQEKGRKPTREELVKELDIPRNKIDRVQKKINSARRVSLYREIRESPLLDYLIDEDGQDPEGRLDRKMARDILTSYINKLKEKERLVITLYYYEELTQKEIAEILDLTPARISQIHKKAVYRLRGYLSRKKGIFV